MPKTNISGIDVTQRAGQRPRPYASVVLATDLSYNSQWSSLNPDNIFIPIEPKEYGGIGNSKLVFSPFP
jgi:hypothetical protein